ncbi:MAG: BamA/TamA family outer membrane protein, partial [Elusimicrobiota bacterium]
AVSGRVAYDREGSLRFFWIGNNTQQADETNYLQKTIGYFWRVGLPIFRDSKWKFNFAHRLSGEKIDNGVFDTLPGIRDRFPEYSADHFHQDSEFQLFIDYDTRDSALTTSEGSYLKFLIENARPGFGGEFTFQRYGIDMRHFHRWDDEGSMITALRYKFEQVLGSAPFYLLPSLGGRTVHRAYGRGRYVDKGLATVTLEQRIIVYKIKVAGVTTELELTPFMGLGTVFAAPKHMARRYMRPVFGGAVRAIARPQVVGSIDIGVGQEGPAVFMDINYSF